MQNPIKPPINISAILLLLLLTGCVSTGTKASAKDFSIHLYGPTELYEGQEFTLSSSIGQPVILNFWFPSCGPCAKELPHIEKLNNEFGDKVEIIGIQMIGIDNTHDGLTFAQKLNLSYKLGYNSDNSTIKKYKINSFLQLYLFQNQTINL